MGSYQWWRRRCLPIYIYIYMATPPNTIAIHSQHPTNHFSLSSPLTSLTRSNYIIGNHPSNIHDCEYAIGTINFTGDMPIILTADGPSLGGFVCIATVVRAE